MEYSRFPLQVGVMVYTAALPEASARHTVGHALCRQAVSDFSGVPPENVAFQKAPGGKPYAVGLETQFSLSHSGFLALCAVGTTPLGADLERRRAVSPRLAERARRAGYEGGDFLLWWTAREANCKRLGRGFTWSPLPQPEHCVQGTLEHQGETYVYTVCW